MMKVDKSLEEVWKWKDEIYEETKNMTVHERVEHLRKGADKLCKEYNLHLETVPGKK